MYKNKQKVLRIKYELQDKCLISKVLEQQMVRPLDIQSLSLSPLPFPQTICFYSNIYGFCI